MSLRACFRLGWWRGFGQPVVIDNRPGAGGTLAEALVAKSAPDGYTMLLSADSPPANAHLYRKLDYELFRDLEPVSSCANAAGAGRASNHSG